jgi:hypothetical protein
MIICSFCKIEAILAHFQPIMEDFHRFRRCFGQKKAAVLTREKTSFLRQNHRFMDGYSIKRA